ncbi:hypothetical protein V8F06_004370 [Rhypophila decipiens]
MSHPEEHQDKVEVEVDDGFEGDEEAAAMAAAMGFSSFGMQESNRPSKKRRFNDGPVDVADAGTGANSLPLHPRESTQIQITDTDEIDLDGDEEDPAVENKTQDQQPPHPAPASLHGLPSKPPPVTAPDFELPVVPPPPEADTPAFQVGGGRGGNFGDRGRGRGGGNGPNRQWYLDYYDPSFNENPWERLEQAKGMSAVGSWLPSRSAGGKLAAKSS